MKVILLSIFLSSQAAFAGQKTCDIVDIVVSDEYQVSIDSEFSSVQDYVYFIKHIDGVSPVRVVMTSVPQTDQAISEKKSTKVYAIVRPSPGTSKTILKSHFDRMKRLIPHLWVRCGRNLE